MGLSGGASGEKDVKAAPCPGTWLWQRLLAPFLPLLQVETLGGSRAWSSVPQIQSPKAHPLNFLFWQRRTGLEPVIGD